MIAEPTLKALDLVVGLQMVVLFTLIIVVFWEVGGALFARDKRKMIEGLEGIL